MHVLREYGDGNKLHRMPRLRDTDSCAWTRTPLSQNRLSAWGYDDDGDAVLNHPVAERRERRDAVEVEQDRWTGANDWCIEKVSGVFLFHGEAQLFMRCD